METITSSINPILNIFGAFKYKLLYEVVYAVVLQAANINYRLQNRKWMFFPNTAYFWEHRVLISINQPWDKEQEAEGSVFPCWQIQTRRESFLGFVTRDQKSCNRVSTRRNSKRNEISSHPWSKAKSCLLPQLCTPLCIKCT